MCLAGNQKRMTPCGPVNGESRMSFKYKTQLSMIIEEIARGIQEYVSSKYI